MKKGLFIALFLIIQIPLFAQNEIGPEGHKLVWVLVVLLPLLAYLMYIFLKKSKNQKKKTFFKRSKAEIVLVKDRLYFPDYLKLTIKNTGNTNIDLERPLLIFDNFWIKRKFRLKGINNAQIYPLYLEAGKTHTLEIDLNGFYRHDKKLKKYPKTKIICYSVEGKKLGSKSVYLRKTLFKY
ncbi:MAG: hypothetical protein JW833_17235 [Prolixibacteraceae bacterium]|nr:hypothetical protein [Prolixibacteraceae bacterium]